MTNIKNKAVLCENCKHGFNSYLLDNKCPFCPYLHLHTGNSCEKFIKITETEETNNGRI